MDKQSKGGKETMENVKFNLVRLYSKDLSLEAPHVSDLVTRELVAEEGNLTLEPVLNFRFKALKDQIFELTAHLKLTAKSGESLLYLLEIQQVAIFSISGPDLNADSSMAMLRQVGPSIIFPHLAELVSNLTFRTSLPPVDLTNMLRISASASEAV